MNSRHKGITKDEIMGKALELFLERSYHGTSTDQICNSLRISKPTLYWHFKNKETLLVELMNMMISREKKLVNKKFSDISTIAELIDEGIFNVDKFL